MARINGDPEDQAASIGAEGRGESLNEILANLIVIGVTAVLVAGIFLVVRRKQALARAELAQMALERGWQIETVREPLAWGVRLKSQDWTLEALSRSSGADPGSGSSNIDLSTVWRADVPGSLILIGEGGAPVNLGALGESLTRQLLQRALGPDADGLVEIQAGSASFRQKYRIWAKSLAEAQACLTPAVEAALLDWKGTPPRIQRSRSGLKMELGGVRLQAPAELLAFIRIGEALLAAVAGT
jgi:hypothetical protein